MKANAYRTTRYRVAAGLLAAGLLVAAGTIAYSLDDDPPVRTLDLAQLKVMVKNSFATKGETGSVVAVMADKGNCIAFDGPECVKGTNIVFDAGDGIYKGTDWLAGVQPNQAMRAVGDQPLTDDRGGAGVQVYRLADKTRALRLDRVRGKLRYTSLARRWSRKSAAQEPVGKQQAADLALKAATALGLPREEMGGVRVDTQVGLTGSRGEKAPQARYKMYQVVTMGRKVNGLPVLGSRSRVAVANQGTIQRLKLSWPQFRLKGSLALLSPDALVNRVAGEIMKNQPNAEIKLRAQLVYVPVAFTRTPPRTGISAEDDWEAPVAGMTGRDADDPPAGSSPTVQPQEQRRAAPPVPPEFVPAVLVSVHSRHTPYQVLVPVAVAK